jgi:ferrochelatase
MKRPILFVNFGGPRSLDEIEPFLISLLTDPDVIRTKLPYFLQKILFTRVAKKRAKTIVHDYGKIGGKSPIYEDTEALAKIISLKLNTEVLTFHRYLPSTHADALQKIAEKKELLVFPLFPQFSYATTGSIARFFKEHLGGATKALSWIKSYAAHPSYLLAMESGLREFIQEKNLNVEETALLFSAHGLPQEFIDTGDIYQNECIQSFQALERRFSEMPCKLSYQSKFGRGEWLRPYTDEMCQNPTHWCEGRKNVVIVPLSFTSDHIETLFEIEEQYLPPLRRAGLHAYRCPALNLRTEWIEAISEILQETNFTSTTMLIKNY